MSVLPEKVQKNLDLLQTSFKHFAAGAARAAEQLTAYALEWKRAEHRARGYVAQEKARQRRAKR